MRNGVGPMAPKWWRQAAFFVVMVASLSSVGKAHAQFGPESVQVRQAIEQGVKFIEASGATDSRMGAHALAGLAMLKHGLNRELPPIRRAVESIQKTLGDRDPEKLSFREIYGPGLAAIFLIELDPGTYRREIECLLEYLRRVQKPHGGWGYSDRETGDTSMVQYAVLAFWEAQQAGFTVEQSVIEAVAEWLLRTQDPSGGYGYQGVVSPTWQPVPQTSIRLSLTAAGLGSLYICADLLNLSGQAPQREEGIPSVLREVRDGQSAKRDAKTRIDAALVRAAQRRGNEWIAENFQIDPKQWTHYYLYALERYMSFREAAEGDNAHRIPWYSQGAAFLVQTQQDPGSWTGQGGATADTAFGLLFLMRSMRKSIDKAQGLGAGLLVGGRGLPKDTGQVELRRGQVIARPLMGPAEELLAMLDDPANEDYGRALTQLTELSPDEAQKLFGDRPDRLKQLARDASPQARLAAVHALGVRRDLGAVPLLIASLDDVDAAVVRAARDALRRLARRPTGFGLPDSPTASERAEAIRQWKAWYVAVRPNAEFEN